MSLEVRTSAGSRIIVDPPQHATVGQLKLKLREALERAPKDSEAAASPVTLHLEDWVTQRPAPSSSSSSSVFESTHLMAVTPSGKLKRMEDSIILSELPVGSVLEFQVAWSSSYAEVLRKVVWPKLRIPTEVSFRELSIQQILIVCAFESLTLGILALLLAAFAQCAWYWPKSWSETVEVADQVPVTFQTFGVLVLSNFLGRWRAAVTVGIYLLSIVAGAPFGAEQQGGYILLRQTTAGFLVGFFLCALVVGTLAQRGWDRQWRWSIASMFIGTIVIYLCGLIWLPWGIAAHSHITAYEAVCGFKRGCVGNTIWFGLVPFIPGDVIKAFAASLLLPLSWQLYSRYHHQSVEMAEM